MWQAFMCRRVGDSATGAEAIPSFIAGDITGHAHIVAVD
jgi:hypothetical protein